jgi:DNA repair protein RecN (Recombination protein N)
MLRSLSIQNIVLVTKLDIDFGEGFCVLTGETGAGKSILLDSLSLALGMRAESRLLRHGENKGQVVAGFELTEASEINALLAEHEIDMEGELLLRRVLYADGRSKAFINDCPVSVQLLQSVGELLVEIHGQHDQRGLLNASTHRAILDGFAGAQAQGKSTHSAYQAWKLAEEAFSIAKRQAEQAQKEEEFLRHALEELNELNPEVGEEERLANTRILMMNSEKIANTLSDATKELHGNNPVTDALRAASRILERSSVNAGEIFEPAIAALDKAIIETDEAMEVLERIGGELNMDVNELERVEDRLFTMRAAAKKYNITADELPAHREKVAAELELLDNTDVTLAKLQREAEDAKAAYVKQAEILSKQRNSAANTLETRVAAELVPLKMSAAEVKVQITRLEEADWNAHGMDKIAFVVRTNAGSPHGPLSKIASGGELSRFMLALKVVLSDTKTVGTLIFDEIDTGIGGAVADAVGRRLTDLGKKAQVLSVTHQPQVAALGNFHLKVEKETQGDATTSRVLVLDTDARKEEIARMLAGNQITSEARAAAEKLMNA